MNDTEAPAKYNVAIVEAAVLEVAAELHPEHLSSEELSLKIVSDPDDNREVETAARAIRGLREFGLFKEQGRRDRRAHPGLRAVAPR